MKQPPDRLIPQLGRVLSCCCLLPFIMLLVGAATTGLAADPVEQITATTGLWALRFMMASLIVAAARGWPWSAQLRLMFERYAFFYTFLHILAYIVFEQFFAWDEMATDIGKRPHLVPAYAAFALMIALGIVSTPSMLRRIGARARRLLHRGTYVIAAAAVLHYFWLVEKDISDPARYALILAILLCSQLYRRPRKSSAVDTSSAPPIAPSM
jgi:methionine sulfoxide reductase heme-binding subunit